MPQLLQEENLIHAFSTKEEGNISFVWDKNGTALENRKKFLDKVGLSIDDCVCVHVQNNDDITVVDKTYLGRGMTTTDDAMKVDCLITTEPNVNLFLPIADCVPIILFDPIQNVLAIIHAAWQTTDKLLSSKTLKKLVQEFGCRPENIKAYFGPGITSANHIFKDPIQKQKPEWSNFLTDLPSGETAIDVIGYNKYQLESEGVLSENIYISGIDTVQNREFYSHYRDSRENPDQEGRFCCMVGMK